MRSEGQSADSVGTCLSVELSREECLFVTLLLGLGVPTWVDSRLSRTETRYTHDVLVAGCRSLLERGWVRPGTGAEVHAVLVDSALVALFGTCAAPERMIVCGHRTDDSSLMLSRVFIGRHLVVIQNPLPSGSHCLVGTTSQAEAVRHVVMALRLHCTDAANGESVRVRRAALETATRDARDLLFDGAEIPHTAGEAGPNGLEPLLDVLESRRAVSFLAMVAGASIADEAANRAFSLLATDRGLWKASVDVFTDEMWVTFAPVASSEVVGAVSRFIAKAN